jgi:hypothetical protein
MKALIIQDISKFPILNIEGDSYWKPPNNTVSGNIGTIRSQTRFN